MKAVIQRVANARVDVDGKTVGSVEKGFLVLLGVMDGDTDRDAEILAAKTAKLAFQENIALKEAGEVTEQRVQSQTRMSYVESRRNSTIVKLTIGLT